MIEATSTDPSGALRLLPTVRRACVPEPVPLPPSQQTDADGAAAASAAMGFNNTKVEVLGYFEDPITGKKMVRKRVSRLVKRIVAA